MGMGPHGMLVTTLKIFFDDASLPPRPQSCHSVGAGVPRRQTRENSHLFGLGEDSGQLSCLVDTVTKITCRFLDHLNDKWGLW
jgi:hypothetical protein